MWMIFFCAPRGRSIARSIDVLLQIFIDGLSFWCDPQVMIWLEHEFCENFDSVKLNVCVPWNEFEAESFDTRDLNSVLICAIMLTCSESHQRADLNCLIPACWHAVNLERYPLNSCSDHCSMLIWEESHQHDDLLWFTLACCHAKTQWFQHFKKGMCLFVYITPGCLIAETGRFPNVLMICQSTPACKWMEQSFCPTCSKKICWCHWNELKVR